MMKVNIIVPLNFSHLYTLLTIKLEKVYKKTFDAFDVFFQAEDGIRDQPRSRGLGDVYKRQEEIDNVW